MGLWIQSPYPIVGGAKFIPTNVFGYLNNDKDKVLVLLVSHSGTTGKNSEMTHSLTSPL